VRALQLRRELHGASKQDVEAVRVFLSDFPKPTGKYILRVNHLTDRATVFKPQPGAREAFLSRIRSEQEQAKSHKANVRRSCCDMAEKAVQLQCRVSIELPLPVGLSWEQALRHRVLFMRRVRERASRLPGGDPQMIAAVRATGGVPSFMSV
jgi:hypothetical protein